VNTILPISFILQLARICQYQASISIANLNAFNYGSIDPTLARLIYMERVGIQNRYNLNPNDPTLISTGNYLFSILKGVQQAALILANQTGSKPVITGPNSQSVNVGANATFTISVTSSTNYTIQWYLGAAPIIGATGLSYTITDAELSQSGGVYSAIVTNSAGSVSSANATLTVTSAEVGHYYYGNTDYSSQLQSSIDDVPYQSTFPITTGQPLSVQFPSGADGPDYIVVKYPSTESIKTTYANAPINNGTIPSIAFDSIVTFGGWRYILSKTGNPFSQNTANPVIFT
jgi:hypothetical protein